MSYALLDDCDASATQATSRLYTGLVRELASYGADDVDRVCEQAARAVEHEGLHAVVMADYEWGALVSHDHIAADVIAKAQAGKPALRFLLYARCERLSREQVDRWLAQLEHGQTSEHPEIRARVEDQRPARQRQDQSPAQVQDPQPQPQPRAGLAQVVSDTSRAQFDAAIAEIHAALERGDTYQINYTYRLGFNTFGTPVALYCRLRARQPVRYGALIALPDGRHVLSCSPELFLRHEQGTLHAQPMKGTAARVDDADADERARSALAADAKNRAENLMIVDLLRNDIGRVAQTGSVSVPDLFSVNGYGRVWQMTSTVCATLRETLTFAQVMRALFPCGSITGAPKHRAMDLIAALEQSARGLYTGSIGWLAPRSAGQACGDFCLSVAIRTLVLEPGGRAGQMGVGAGIVLDSDAASEWEECKVKAQFATGLDAGIGLFETMRATRDAGVAHLDRHLARLVHSATELGLPVAASATLDKINAYVAMLSDGEHRVRLSLHPSGSIEIGGGPLTPVALSAQGTVAVLLADEFDFAPTDADDALLAHKTTSRETYDKAWRLAEQHGAFDMLFFNTRGELTEGGRTNVFVRLDGRWTTPPLSSGLLPGVMRGVLLEDPAWSASERVLTRDDLMRAEAVVVCNALRGVLHAELVRTRAPVPGMNRP
ncbi:MAG TPA: aminodeoxychorismate synthase component I [Pararobbsia sp.]|nr:aminodeoxychorismate synthase component I [Pararobbsia sp.]